MQCYCCNKDGVLLRQVGDVKLALCTTHYRTVDKLFDGIAEMGSGEIMKVLDQIRKENSPPDWAGQGR